MSARQLVVHPAAPFAGELVIWAGATSSGDRLTAAFELICDLAALRLPPPSPASRRLSGLWEHTCVEAFLAPATGSGYLELNVSPSADWALWSFDAYREGMRPAPLDRAPEIVVARTPNGMRIAATLAVRELERLLGARAAVAGLAAVVEGADGGLSYWACVHPGERPDFHRRDGWPVSIYGGSGP